MLLQGTSLTLIFPALAFAQVCPPWSPDFAPVGTSAEVRALVRFDDGSGETLYAAGAFGATADVVSPGVARWDGTQWTDVGGGLEIEGDQMVRHLRVLAGQGGALLAAVGSFETVNGEPCGGMAVWDGIQWARLADGPPIQANEALDLEAVAVFDGISGSEIWVGGSTRDVDFYISGSRSYLARWDGQAWTRILDGPASEPCSDYYSCPYERLSALEVFDDGSGQALFAGGVFSEIDGAPGSTLARHDGVQWTQVGGVGPGGITGSVQRLSVHDDGGGLRLHLLGSFGNAPDPRLLAYDGQTLAALGAGPGGVYSTMASLPATAGEAAGLWLAPLRPSFATGLLEMLRWDGSQWNAVNVPMGYPVDVHAVESFEGELYAGGEFPRPVAGVASANIARHDGVAWRTVGTGGQGLGTQFSSSSNVASARVHDDGTGAALYVAGEITWADGNVLTNVVRWDGAGWTAIPGFTLPYLTQVDDLVSVDLGQGPELWMAGDIKVGNQNPGAFARWDGSTLTAFAISAEGTALEIYDDGNGPNLFLAQSNSLSRYDGSTFTYLGSGTIRAMTVHDDGSGPRLYVGGSFSTFPSAGGVAANNVVRWDGATWEPVGDGLLGPGGSTFSGTVYALASVDDGTGPKLVAGGLFTESGATPLARLAAWDGSTWSDVGGGVAGPDARVLSLTGFRDGRGDGSVLYVGGDFTEAGGQPARGLARWDGSSWDTAGLTVQGPRPVVRELTVVDLPVFGGRVLLAGGDFDGIDGAPAQRMSVLPPCKSSPGRSGTQAPPARGRTLGP